MTSSSWGTGWKFQESGHGRRDCCLSCNGLSMPTRIIVVSVLAVLLFTVLIVLVAVLGKSDGEGPDVQHVNIHGGVSRAIGGYGNDYWQYSAFRANRSITAVNLGICGPPEGGRYRIRMKFVEEGLVTPLGETEAIAYADGGPESVYFVPFKEPVQLKADRWYRAYVYISEGPPNTFYGTQGRNSTDILVAGPGGRSSVHFKFRFHDGQPFSIGFRVHK